MRVDLEHAVQHHPDDAPPERPRSRTGIALAVGAFVGIGAAMVVAALTDNPLAAVVVVGIAVLAALGAALTLD